MITAIYGLALTTGASRVVKGKRIEHVMGDPNLGQEKDRAYSLRLVRASHSPTSSNNHRKRRTECTAFLVASLLQRSSRVLPQTGYCEQDALTESAGHYFVAIITLSLRFNAAAIGVSMASEWPS